MTALLSFIGGFALILIVIGDLFIAIWGLVSAPFRSAEPPQAIVERSFNTITIERDDPVLAQLLIERSMAKPWDEFNELDAQAKRRWRRQ